MFRRLVGLWFATALILTAPSVGSQESVVPSDIANQIQGALDQPAVTTVGGQSILLPAVQQVYRARAYQPLWQAPGAEAWATQLMTTLAAAGAHGIDDGNFHLSALQDRKGQTDPRNVAETDILLTDAYLRYAGKARPDNAKALGSFWLIEPDWHDPAGALIAAVDAGTFPELLQSLLPAAPQYRLLVDALQRYRGIVAAGGWPAIPGQNELKLDKRDPRLPLLRQRLIAEGDLDPTVADSDIAGIGAGLRQFQTRHGLDPDGRVGSRTVTELNTPAEHRVAQIKANLERWRHMPRGVAPTRVAVNAAAATLEVLRDDVPVLQMRVIVVEPKNPTPVLAAEITGVVLNPPWNVPHKIAQKEIMPKVQRDPNYLAKNNFVVLERGGLRQLPGPKSALGLIKMDMPNPVDVYLHDTPSRKLFQRVDRGLSHGCVRLERPADLALELLGGTRWTNETLLAQIAAGDTRRIALDQKVPVYILYWTAFVEPGEVVNFRRDLYGRDRIDDDNPPGQLPQAVACAAPLGSAGCGA
jgi:murein L,D-transpeptidase YcbB/YkuD